MKVGVVGLGKLGKLHARIYQSFKKTKLAVLCDINPSMRKTFSSKRLASIPFETDYRNLIKYNLQGVSIATPTTTHFEIARFFLERGINCLVEKPLTNNLSQAQNLLKIAKKNKVFLMPGMVERFNSGYLKLRRVVKNPKFIECHRLSPYPHRSLDISVVLDLMIHDLDIILDIVSQPIRKIEALGLKVLSSHPDIATVRLYFKKGTLANITSSRVSEEKIRKFRIFFSSSYASLDYGTQEIKISRKTETGLKKIFLRIKKEEPLRKELSYFLKNSKRKNKDYFLAANSLKALKLALKIEKKINEKE